VHKTLQRTKYTVSVSEIKVVQLTRAVVIVTAQSLDDIPRLRFNHFVWHCARYKSFVCICMIASRVKWISPTERTRSRMILGPPALVIPSHRLTTYGRRAFSVAGPMFWNSLPRHLRDPSHTDAVFARLLKTFLFSEY